MRTQIETILKKYSIDHLFHWSEMAQNRMSQVRVRINDRNQVHDKEYAIKFEQTSQTVAIWSIKDRVLNHDSLDLYANGHMQWNNIADLRVYKIHIGKRSSERFSLVAVMPLADLERFILHNRYFEFGIKIDTTEYDTDELQSVNMEGDYSEGKTIYTYGQRYERSPELRRQAIALQGCYCQICDFNFLETYGALGEGFIEVHHITPLHEGEQQPDPQKDLICACANCHRMLHKQKNKTLSPEELKSIMQNI